MNFYWLIPIPPLLAILFFINRRMARRVAEREALIEAQAKRIRHLETLLRMRPEDRKRYRS